MDKIVVTGIGIISALGYGVEETMRRLLAEESGIGPMRYLKTKHNEIPVGEVPYSDEEMRKFLKLKEEELITRTSLMGRMALAEAVQNAGLKEDASYKTVFLSGTTVGGMERSEQYYRDFVNNDNHKEYIALHSCGANTAMIAQQFPHLWNATMTTSTACSSAVNAIIMGANMLRTGRADIAVVGGSECLSKFHLNGFNTLMILDKQPCRPFDKNREGLNLGEGAAYLVLEKESTAKQRSAKALCYFSGSGNRCDAFHQTASSPEGDGAFLAMQEALREANLQPSDISYINAHGTGTPNNDESEGHAVMRIFGDNVPPISSTKSFTGHTTSASGSVEAVISILALNNNFIPANLRFTEKIDSLNFVPVTRTQTDVELKHILTNSFGFGGNDSSCIFSKINAL